MISKFQLHSIIERTFAELLPGDPSTVDPLTALAEHPAILTRSDLSEILAHAKRAGHYAAYLDDANSVEFQAEADWILGVINGQIDSGQHAGEPLYCIDRRVLFGHLVPIVKAEAGGDRRNRVWFGERLLDQCTDGRRVNTSK